MKRLLILCALTFGCVLLGILFVEGTVFDASEQRRYERELSLLDTHNAKLEQALLRAHSGEREHYDGIVGHLEEIAQLHDNLVRVPDFLADDDKAALEAALARSRELASDKRQRIGRFETENAALFDSDRDLPRALREFESWIERNPAAGGLREPTRELFRRVLEFRIAGDVDSHTEAVAALDGFERARASHPAVPPDFPLHARNILERRPGLDELLSGIFSIPTVEQLQEVQRIYTQGFISAHERGQDFLRALYLGAILLIGGVIYAVDALLRAKRGLERANDGLDRRVAERTALLEAANEQLGQDANSLARLNEELERSNGDLDDFAYIASHDLKEPLRGIHNYAAFLIEDYGEHLDTEGLRKLETMRSLARRMDTLIDSLLYFSRVGRTDLAFGEVDLQELVEEVVASLQVSLEERNAELRIPRALPTVQCDEVRVAEVFRNLISNALKYSDAERPSIEVGSFEPGESLAGATVSEATYFVRDNGIGIREKDFDAIFRIFKRLHGRDKFGGGTGAGLTIVKKIIERHGGRIWVESERGEGTTFYFTLGAKA